MWRETSLEQSLFHSVGPLENGETDLITSPGARSLPVAAPPLLPRCPQEGRHGPCLGGQLFCISSSPPLLRRTHLDTGEGSRRSSLNGRDAFIQKESKNVSGSGGLGWKVGEGRWDSTLFFQLPCCLRPCKRYLTS